MTSEILVRRYDKIFKIYDGNRDGYIEESDLARLRDQFFMMFGESPTSERGAGIAKLWDDLWHALLAATDHVADGRISLQEWREGLPRLIGDEASYNRVGTLLATAVFWLMDADGDGKVGPEEWLGFQKSLGNEGAAESSFQLMDTERNGYLTVEEFVGVVHEYLTSPAPDARGGWLLGAD
jgi:Ca2+-binding EF-hand superfamily protein